MKTRITEMLGIEHPIVQSGTVQVAEHNLTATVSKAGSFGLIGGANAPGEVMRDEVRKARELTDKPFGVNIMLLNPHADDMAKVVAEESIKVVTTGAGDPEKYMGMWKTAGIKVIPVVASVALARRMEKYGADIVVAKGVESDGHTGEQTTTTLVPQTVDTASIPVIAVGGIGSGRGTAAASMLGTEAVQMGTRFVVVKESIVHGNHKQRTIRAKDIDSTVIGRSHGCPIRGLRNQVIRECIKLGQEGRSFEELEYLALGVLRKAIIEGDVNGGTVMAGRIAGMISKEQTCKEMIEEIMMQTGKLMHWNQRPGMQAPDWMGTSKIQDEEITGVDRIAFIFPGQGAQTYEIGKGFYEQIGTGKRIFDKATQLMGLSMPQPCFEENDRLDIAEYTQAAVVIVNIAMMCVLKEDGIKPGVAAGPSLGEYCALAATGVMNDEGTVWMARRRRILMQEAIPVGEGTMAAILALDTAAIKEVTGAMEGVWIANYNCPGQIVISGEKAAVEKMCGKLEAAGAKGVVMPSINGPSHSGMLTAVGEKLGQVPSRVELHGSRTPYVVNVAARRARNAAEVKELLTRQVSSSARWQQGVETMIGGGVDAFIEVDPGKTLAGSMRKISRDVKTLDVKKLEDIGRAAEAPKL